MWLSHIVVVCCFSASDVSELWSLDLKTVIGGFLSTNANTLNHVICGRNYITLFIDIINCLEVLVNAKY